MKNIRLWKDWIDHFVTGEGRTVMGMIGHAVNEEAFRKKLTIFFGELFSMGSEVGPGLIRNGATEILWSKYLLDFIDANNGRGTIEVKASAHINFS